MTTIALVSAIIALPAGASAQITEAQKGAGVGVLLGAGTGAIVGAAVHHPIAGTLIGAGMGGVGGYGVGHQLEQQDAINNQDRHVLLSQQRQLQQQRREIEQLQQMQSTE
jgi:uncharacterized membrane protein